MKKYPFALFPMVAFLSLLSVIGVGLVHEYKQYQDVKHHQKVGEDLFLMAMEDVKYFTNGKYSHMRPALIQNGWEPFRAADASECKAYWNCEDKPETVHCFGTGRAGCTYSWKKNEVVIKIYAHQNGVYYDSFAVEQKSTYQ